MCCGQHLGCSTNTRLVHAIRRIWRRLAAERRVRATHGNGHCGDPWNELVDVIADAVDSGLQCLRLSAFWAFWWLAGFFWACAVIPCCTTSCCFPWASMGRRSRRLPTPQHRALRSALYHPCQVRVGQQRRPPLFRVCHQWARARP